MMTHDDFLKIEKQFYAYTRPFVDRAENPYPLKTPVNSFWLNR